MPRFMPRFMTSFLTLRRIGTIALALLGTLIFWLAGLPLPFLFGPMFACLIAALLGAPLQGVAPISSAARTILGVAVGAWGA